ncbi:MAG: antibiotic biosynthesis monooxygenase [Desulfobulbaceae bacterium]|nr:antibiotic biosynthesis monooxygenase [Desulfobulbaceae bacterium]
MIIVTLRIKVPRDRRRDFMDSARLIVEPTRIQSGCISCWLYQDSDEPDVVLLVEEWESRKELDHHINSDQYRIVLSLMEASDQFPEIKLNTISKTEGLEAIEAVRSGKEENKHLADSS